MRTRVLVCLCALSISVAANAAERPATPEQKLKVEIVWDPATPQPEGKIWMTYLFTRAAYAAKHPDTDAGVPGEREPSFEEEVRARQMALAAFRDQRKEDRALVSDYFSDVERVEAAGFLREYVWRYLRRDSWNLVPLGLHLSDFDEWRETELPHHVPVTHGRIALKLAAK